MVYVLIIGAGPVGLTMACQCLRYKIPFRIIEKRSGPSKESRALAIHARTLEVLHYLGVVKNFTNKGLPIRKGLIHINGDLKMHLDFTNLETPYPYVLGLDQSETERILEKHLETNGFRVERNKELISLSKNGHAIVRFKGKKEKIKARYVIACDGAHSKVRKELGIKFRGLKYGENFVLSDINIKINKNKSSVMVYANKDGVLAFFPLPHKNRYRLIATMPKKTNETSLEMLQEIVNKRAGKYIKISNPIWTSMFSIHKRMVPRMRHGNIFLLGDAAHIHSPVGGQGMNIGIHETDNLGWKLKLILEGASDKLLDTFNEERYPIVKEILKGTDVATKFALSNNYFLLLLKSLLLPVIDLVKPIKKELVRNMSELLINYENSSIVKENWKSTKGIKAGYRALDIKISKKKQLFDVLKKGRHCILIFGNSGKFRKLSKFSEVYSVKVKSKAGRLYGVEKEGIYIIRPDGYVGYRCDELNLGGCEGYFDMIEGT
jgi:3-(3-hydroxy-phenyl)propionate hydroxylase